MRYFNFFNQKHNRQSFLGVYFFSVLVIFDIIAISRIFCSTNYLLDTYEHIHASWLISSGLVPYRDFFEHHHPLLWYLFAPLTQLFYRDVNIIYVARFIAVFGYFCTLYLLYIVSKKYNNSSTGGFLSVFFVLCIPSLWFDIQNLRPDIFMYISILGAALCFFKYLDTHKLFYVCLCYILWFLAFLFLQKAIIYGSGFFMAHCWLTYKKQTSFSDMVKALIWPLLMILLLLLVLHSSEILNDWYKYNFTFNMYIKQYFGLYSSGTLILPSLNFLATIIIVRVYKPSDKGVTVLGMWGTSLLSILDFAPHAQYYFFTFILAAILLSPLFLRLYNKNYLLSGIFGTIFLSYTFYNLLPSKKSFQEMKDEIFLADLVIQQTSPSEKILNGSWSYNLFNPDTNYYWFGFYTVTILADLYLDKHFDYNEQIKTHKPKFLFIPVVSVDRLAFSNSIWFRDRNHALLQKVANGDKHALAKLYNFNHDYWRLDTEYIKANYKFIDTYGATELWQRIGNESNSD